MVMTRSRIWIRIKINIIFSNDIRSISDKTTLSRSFCCNMQSAISLVMSRILEYGMHIPNIKMCPISFFDPNIEKNFTLT